MAGFDHGEFRGADSTRVVEKVRRILDCFSSSGPLLRAAEVHRATGLPSTTCARLLKALVHEDILERHGDQFRIGLRVFGWTASAAEGSELVTAARPVLDDLRDATGETCCLFVRYGGVRMCVAVAESDQAVIHRLAVGQVRPLHAGASGKVFMAYDDSAWHAALRSGLEPLTPKTVTEPAAVTSQLSRVRELGYSLADEEREVGLSSIAAPVFGPSATLKAVLAVGAPAFRLGAGQASRLAPLVMQAAAALSRRMGHGTANEGMG